MSYKSVRPISDGSFEKMSLYSSNNVFKELQTAAPESHHSFHLVIFCRIQFQELQTAAPAYCNSIF